MAKKNNRINIEIGASLKKFSSDMQNVKRQMRNTGRKMKSLGQSMTRSLTAPLGLVGVASAKLAADFEQSMAKVQAISGATGAGFKALNENALELGRTTRYTAQQVAELQLNLSKLGFDPKEITDATGAILNLALATGEDLASSATTAAATIKGFGLEASDAGMVSDVMAKSFSSSALDLEKFSTAMAVVAPVANKAGVSLEETTAILGTLTDRGVDASSAGAALRNIYLDLADNGISWSNAMKRLQTSQNPLSEAMELFGKRGAAVASIIADNVDSIERLTSSLKDSGGAASNMAKIMDDTAKGSLFRLNSALQGIAIEIGDALIPVFRSLADWLSKMADRFGGMSDHSKKLLLIFGGLAAAAGPVVFVAGSMVSSFGSILGVLPSLIIGIKTLGAALTTFMANPATIAILTLTSLFIALSVLKPKVKELSDEQKRSAQFVKDLNKVQNDAAVKAETQRIKLERLNNVIKDNTIRENTRRDAIISLRKEMPSYLKNISDEELLTKGATKQIDLYVSALKSKAIAQGLQAQIQQKANRLAELEVQKAQPEIPIAPQFKIDSYGNRIIDEQAKSRAEQFRKTAKKMIESEISNLNKEIDSLIKIQDKYKQASDFGDKDINNLGGDLEDTLDKERQKQFEKRLKDNQKYLAELSKQRIENITNEKRQALELAAWNSEQRIKEIQNSLADEKIKNDLINEETKRADSERISIIQDFNTKAKKERFDNELKSLEAFNKQKSTHLIESLNANQITEQTFQQQSLQNDLEFLKLKLELYKKFGKDLTDLQLDLAKKQQDIQDKMADGTTDSWVSTFKSMEMSIENFISDTIGGFLDALGQEMAGSTKAIDRFGENIIASFGKFISQFGQMLMAYGVAKTVLFKGGPMSGPAAIAAGAALVILGGALKQMSNRASEAADGGYGNYGVGDTFAPPSTGGGSSHYGTSNDVMTLETVVYGRDIVLSSNRQHGTISRTRRK